MGSSDVELSNPMVSAIELSPSLIAYIAAFFQYIGLFSVFPLYIQITQGLSDVETVEIWAIISGIALLVGALTRIPAGLLSDRIGRFFGYMVAYFVYFLGLLFILAISTNIVYIIAMSLIRFGSNMVAMSSRALVSTSARDIGLKNGLLQSMAGMGSFLGPLALGYVLDHYEPVVVLYVSLFVVTADMMLFIALYYGIGYFAEQRGHSIDLDYEPVQGKNPIDLRKALSNPLILEIYFLFFTTGLIFGLMQSIYSIYGYNILELSTTTIGVVTGVAALSQTVAAPVAGRLQLFVKDEYLRIMCWVIVLLSTIFASVSPLSIAFYYVAYLVLNVGMSSYFTVEITRLSREIDQKEFSFVFGLASSMVILATSVAGFASPSLYSIGPETNFFVGLGLGMVSLALVIFTTPRWLGERFKDGGAEN